MTNESLPNIPLPNAAANQQANLLSEMRAINFKRILYVTAVSIVVNVFFAITFFLKKSHSSPYEETLWAQGIFLLHTTLIIVNAFVLFTALYMAHSGLQRSQWSSALTIIHCCFIIGWGLAASMIDQLVTPAIHAFVINVLIVAVVFYVKPGISIIIFFLSFICFYVGMVQMQHNPALLLSNLLNAAGFLLGCMVISIVFWTNKMRSLRQRETILSQKKKLEMLNIELGESNAAKDKFLSIISHDLRGNVNNSISVAQILTEEKSLDDADKNYFIQILSDSLQQTSALLENLLLWSKNRTQKLVYKPELFSLPDLLQHIISLQDAMIKNKSIELDFQPAEDYIVYADREMISTVFRNLLTNAVKYCNKNGTIRIDLVKTDNEIEATICDDGIGMTDELLRKLFVIEYKTSTDGTEQEKGTGLGLILCMEFVEKNKGKISVRSEKGKGSCFSVTLPATAEPRQLNA